jgi:hypothetical protein
MGQRKTKQNSKRPVRKRHQDRLSDSESESATADASTRPLKKRAHRVELEEVDDDRVSEVEEVDVDDVAAPQKACRR